MVNFQKQGQLERLSGWLGGREGGKEGGYKVQESERLLVTVKVRAVRRLMLKVSWCLS